MTDKKIILTRGLMASGKSTWAKMMAKDPSYARVSRDDIRLMTQDTAYGGPIDEDLVTKIETESVKAILKSGRTPIVDAMHLYQRQVNRWQRLGYPIEIVTFEGIPLDILRERNWMREAVVPDQALVEKFNKFAVNPAGYLKPVKLSPEQFVTSNFEKYVPNPELPEAFVFDIDGTLAHMTGRSPYDYSRVSEDKVDTVVRDVLVQLQETYPIIIVSGRKAECRAETLAWLNKNYIYPDGFFMRADGDNRPDTIVKYEILMNEIAPKFAVEGVFDDRDSVVEMWRNVGLKCFHVQEGDF